MDVVCLSVVLIKKEEVDRYLNHFDRRRPSSTVVSVTYLPSWSCYLVQLLCIQYVGAQVSIKQPT